MSKTCQVRVLVIDGNTVERKGLSSLLNAMPSVEVVGEAATTQEGLMMARESRPDVVLIGHQVIRQEGMVSVWRIWLEDAEAAVVVLMNIEGDSSGGIEVDTGRIWFAPSDIAPDELAAAIQGMVNLSPSPGRTRKDQKKRKVDYSE